MPRDVLLNPPRRVSRVYPVNLDLGALTDTHPTGFSRSGRWAKRRDKLDHPLFIIWSLLTPSDGTRPWVHVKEIAEMDKAHNHLAPGSGATIYRYVRKLFQAGYIEAATDGECLYARLLPREDAKWKRLLAAYGMDCTD